MSVHSKPPNAEKGVRYVSLLDQALCNGNWSEVPELVRKVDKHAPQRKCLTTAARAQYQAATASQRPTSASSANASSIHGLGTLIPLLQEAIAPAKENYQDDAYLASVCLAEIYWLRETPLEALNILSDVESPSVASGAPPGPLGWLEVSAVKANFIKASCLESNAQHSQARELYQATVQQAPGYRTPELRLWTERLLAQACMHSVKKIPSPSLEDMSETYAAFRAWGEFWQRVTAASVTNLSVPSRLDIPRRQVWKTYYDLLSTVLQHGLLNNAQPGEVTRIVPSTDILEKRRVSLKQQQRAEIKRVEATYESLLLKELHFPKASQSNTEVEEWAEQVIANWRIFAGIGWSDTDLEEDGKRSVSRGVLDILYRAATKTFHSTPILRYLFTVHAARGEFDLAIDAFDSYVEIVDRGKARAQKTGKHEIGFDDDDTAMLTAAEAIRVLCRYGEREQAEKAMKVSAIMQKWLDQLRPVTSNSKQINSDDEEGASERQTTASTLKSETLAATYRALGISRARWALLTYESETRSLLLTEASANLRRAQNINPESIETAHALALVLAETRDVSGALDVIRTAISTKAQRATADGSKISPALRDQQRRLIPLWHLLALCLTAEDEFESAVQVCETAYQQLGDYQTLFGETTTTSFSDPGSPPSTERSARTAVSGIDGCEKESLLQIKMTQITLFELTEGADEAVDLTDELLSLYSRLFGKPEQIAAEIVTRSPATAASPTPSRLGGTLKSITGSIRPRSMRSTHSLVGKDDAREKVISENGSPPGIQSATNGTTLGAPIAITITNEEGIDTAEKPHRHSHLPHLPFQGRRHRGDNPSSRTPENIAEHGENEENDEKAAVPGSAEVKLAEPIQLSGEIAHNAPHEKEPLPLGHKDQPPRQDVRLPAPPPASAATLPDTQLSLLHERRHKVTVLINAWLFSAELYIRADSFEDAENLLNDAIKLTESMQLELAKYDEASNSRRMFNRGWGSGKSVDELWADVWATKAHLASARELPFDALAAYEQALSYWPDHAAAIIGLSNLLMDMFEEKLAAERPLVFSSPLPIASGSLIKEVRPPLTRPSTSATLPSRQASFTLEPEAETTERKIDPLPAELNRLAARDRAYMLISNLTKQGAGWDNSEAWLTLARAHELSREIGKAKRALWWVVELENNRPIRPWKEISPGGYTV